MPKRKIIIALLFAAVFLNVKFCFAQSLSSSEIIQDAKYHDGKEITYEGEIVGDIMKRSNTIWFNVNDGENAIGINCNEVLIKNLNLLAGGYNKKGDWIKVTGILNNVCKSHAGDLDIHANSIEIIKKGENLDEKVNSQKKQLIPQLILFLLCLLILKLFIMRLRK